MSEKIVKQIWNICIYQITMIRNLSTKGQNMWRRRTTWIEMNADPILVTLKNVIAGSATTCYLKTGVVISCLWSSLPCLFYKSYDFVVDQVPQWRGIEWGRARTSETKSTKATQSMIYLSVDELFVWLFWFKIRALYYWQYLDILILSCIMCNKLTCY